jgi:hypothetical protein
MAAELAASAGKGIQDRKKNRAIASPRKGFKIDIELTKNHKRDLSLKLTLFGRGIGSGEWGVGSGEWGEGGRGKGKGERGILWLFAVDLVI